MNNRLFREKSVERIVSPEQLNDYIHVSNPAAWIVLAAFAILLVGICIWGIFGRLDTTLSVAAVKMDDQVVCFMKETDCEKVRVGMIVKIEKEEFSVTGIEKMPILVDDSIHEYVKHIGDLSDGEWVYYVYTDIPDLKSDVLPAEIIVERVNPLYFVTN